MKKMKSDEKRKIENVEVFNPERTIYVKTRAMSWVCDSIVEKP